MTDRLRWQQIEALFDGALSRPSAERADWLAVTCPDVGLREEVERLLAAHERVGGILDRVPLASLASEPESSTTAAGPDDLRARVESALAGRYVVERELGRGGMATVFRALERKHARRVVLKVLNPEVAARWGAERFSREVQIAARLAHPNIVGLIDSGEADGLLYYVMPFVEGETLRERIDRTGALPVGDALSLLRDVAGALAHAHEAGVVHRDLKPANVLCAGQHAFLLDFGVAKLLAPDASPPLTRQGIAVGTPAYMAPEQSRAGAGMDHRVDLYAWGLLAFEMLAGHLPPRGNAAGSAVRALAMDGLVPDDVADLVAHCLAADPADRPPSAEALLERLASVNVAGSAVLTPPAGAHAPVTAWRRWTPRVALAAGAVAVLIAAVMMGRGARGRGMTDEELLPTPVAVGVLVNETGDPALDAWGRMAGDWITQGLQETGLVPVVAWPTALQASELVREQRGSGRVVNPIAVMRDETGAGTIVSGAYYGIGDSLHFRVQVVRAATGQSIGALPAVVVPRDSAHLAVRTLRDRLMAQMAIWTDERMRAVPGLARRPPTYEAYLAFDRGIQRYLSQDYRGAAPEFRAAHALDSSFVVSLIYASTAYLNVREVARAESLAVLLQRSRADLSSYHAALADWIAAMLAGDVRAELVALRRAAAEAPGSRAAYNLALVAIELDQPEEALAALQRLDPDRGEMRGWSSYFTQLAHAHHMLGDYEAEAAAARGMRSRYPDRRVGLVLEARARAAAGRLAALDSLLDEARPLSPATYWSQGAAMVVAGQELIAHGHDTTRARALLEEGVAWLAGQRELDPSHVGHREWLADALYSLHRWPEAHALHVELVRDDPTRSRHRGLLAVTAARLGRPDAEELLGAPPVADRGGHMVYRARIAAIRGERERALSLLAEGITQRVSGLEWLHASAQPDLRLLGQEPRVLPAALRPGEHRRGVSAH